MPKEMSRPSQQVLLIHPAPVVSLDSFENATVNAMNEEMCINFSYHMDSPSSSRTLEAYPDHILRCRPSIMGALPSSNLAIIRQLLRGDAQCCATCANSSFVQGRCWLLARAPC